MVCRFFRGRREYRGTGFSGTSAVLRPAVRGVKTATIASIDGDYAPCTARGRRRQDKKCTILPLTRQTAFGVAATTKKRRSILLRRFIGLGYLRVLMSVNLAFGGRDGFHPLR